MTETPSLEAALRRLSAALSHLEEAAESRTPALGEEGATGQGQSGLDQAELVRALDDSRARAGRLDAANRDVARRVEEAVSSIEAVLDGESGTPARPARGGDKGQAEGEG